MQWLRQWRERLAAARSAEQRPAKPKRRQLKQQFMLDSDSDDDFMDPEADILEANALPSVTVLIGPSGSGKAAAIAACAQELSFTTLELNTSDVRSGRNVTRVLQDATTSHHVGGSTAAAASADDAAAEGGKSHSTIPAKKAKKSVDINPPAANVAPLFAKPSPRRRTRNSAQVRRAWRLLQKRTLGVSKKRWCIFLIYPHHQPPSPPTALFEQSPIDVESLSPSISSQDSLAMPTLPHSGSNMGLVEASVIVIEDVDVTFESDKVGVLMYAISAKRPSH
jgi:hypothetical protein